MSLRPLKHFGAGAFKELLTSEEDYLAYQAGYHLGQMTTDDLSALSINDQGTLVGIYEDTFYTSGIGSIPGETIARTFEVNHLSDIESSIHTTTFTEGYIPLPSTVYVGDTLQITIAGSAASSGAGFEEIEYQIGLTGSAQYSITSVTSTPTPTNTTGLQATWEDYQNGSLSGSYQTVFSIQVTNTGILNFTVNATSTDLQNATPSAFDNIQFNSVRVEPQQKPNTAGAIYELYQNDANVSSLQTSPLKRNPFYWNRAANPPGLKEMSDAEIDIVCERLLKKIFANDLPGTFRLSSASPGPDWSEFL